MNRLYVALVLFFILPLASVPAQTVTPQNSPVPHQGSLLFSAGPAFASDKLASSFPISSTQTGYGGYIALDYFVTKALALRSELAVFSVTGETNVVATAWHHGVPYPHSVFVNVPARTIFVFGVGPRLYPLQLTKYRNLRLQPFAEVQVGGMFFISSSSIQGGTSIDPCPFLSAGGGVDFAFNARWSATFKAEYYSSLSDTHLHEDGLAIPFSDYGLLATASIRYQF